MKIVIRSLITNKEWNETVEKHKLVNCFAPGLKIIPNSELGLNVDKFTVMEFF